MLVKNWEFSRDANLQDVLAWSRDKGAVDRLLVVCRHLESVDRTQTGTSAEEVTSNILQSHLIAKIEAGAWPGSELFGHRALVFVARFDDECAKRMVAAERLLFGWRHTHSPPLPEDICLFRVGDSLPVFFSVTHENRGWCISETRPTFARDATFSPCQRRDLLIPEGEYFCDRGILPL